MTEPTDAGRELAVIKADMARIDEIAVVGQWAEHWRSEETREAATIAARHRVETDPLVEALDACCWNAPSAQGLAADLRAELAKRGVDWPLIGGAK